MTKTSLTSDRQGKSCGCARPEIDNVGNVVLLQTCPVCMNAALDNIRGVEYSMCYEKGVRQKTIQRELFSFSPYSRSGTREITEHGEP